MNAAYLLARCDHIADISAVMLAAARNGNWPEVERLKEDAATAIDEVRAHAAKVALSAQERQLKHASITRILINDGKIRNLAQPWHSRLSQISQLSGQQTNQRRADGSDDDPLQRVFR